MASVILSISHPDFAVQLRSLGIGVVWMTRESAQCFCVELRSQHPLFYVGVDATTGYAVVLLLETPHPAEYSCTVKFLRSTASEIVLHKLPGKTTVKVPGLMAITPYPLVGPDMWQMTENLFWQRVSRWAVRLLEVDRSPCYCIFPSGKVVFAPVDRPSWSREVHLGTPGAVGDNYMASKCVHREGLLSHKPVWKQIEDAKFVPFGVSSTIFHKQSRRQPLFLVHPAKDSEVFYFIRPSPRFCVPPSLSLYSVETQPSTVLHVRSAVLNMSYTLDLSDEKPRLQISRYEVWSEDFHPCVGPELRQAITAWLLCGVRKKDCIAMELLAIILEYACLISPAALERFLAIYRRQSKGKRRR